MSDVLARHAVRVSGDPAGQPMLFAHGFGCDQTLWRFVTPAFADGFRVITFDYVGAGGSDRRSYDPERYATLGGYAEDVLEICRALDLENVSAPVVTVSIIAGVSRQGYGSTLRSRG